MRDLKLDQQVCYAMHQAVRAFDGVYRTLLREHGLSYPQYIALMTLGEHDALTVGDLGTLLHLDSGTLSPLLKRMQSAGLLERSRDPHDERRVLVRLTATGRDRLTAVAGVPREMAARSGLTRSELADLQATLRAITETLEGASTKG